MISMELRKIWGSENARGSLFDVNREFGHTNIKNLLRRLGYLLYVKLVLRGIWIYQIPVVYLTPRLLAFHSSIIFDRRRVRIVRA